MVDRDGEFSEYAGARWRTLVHSAMLLGAGLPDAEDVAQATLLKCYLAWPKVARAENREAYVARVLLNTLRADRRRRWRGERPAARLPESGAPDRTTEVDGVDAVARALGGLTDQHREVVVLRYYRNLSEQQIADVLRVPPGTVKSRLSRALARLAGDPHLADLTDRPDGSTP